MKRHKSITLIFKMKNFIMLFYVAIELQLLEVFCQEHIKLLPYNQTQSTTQCTHGLISGQDKFVLYGEIYFTQWSESPIKVDIHIKSHTISQSTKGDSGWICLIDFKNPKYMNQSLKCFCESKHEICSNKFVINETATNGFSEKKMSAIFSLGNKTIWSEDEKLPYMNDGKGIFKVNGNQYHNFTEKCNTKVNSMLLTLDLEEKIRPNRLRISEEVKENHVMLYKQYPPGKREFFLEITTCQSKYVQLNCTIVIDVADISHEDIIKPETDPKREIQALGGNMKNYLTTILLPAIIPVYLFMLVIILIQCFPILTKPRLWCKICKALDSQEEDPNIPESDPFIETVTTEPGDVIDVESDSAETEI